MLDREALTIGYSDFQKEHCILRRHGVTAFGMYVQCLREIEARESVPRDDWSPALLRDLEWFKQRAAALEREIGDITHEQRERLDCERYVAKASKELLLDLLATGRPARSTLDLIACLPTAHARRLFRTALDMPRAQVVALLEESCDDDATMSCVLATCDARADEAAAVRTEGG